MDDAVECIFIVVILPPACYSLSCYDRRIVVSDSLKWRHEAIVAFEYFLSIKRGQIKYNVCKITILNKQFLPEIH